MIAEKAADMILGRPALPAQEFIKPDVKRPATVVAAEPAE
jgi:hypothetical protein